MAYPQRRDQVHVLALHFGDSQLSRTGPHIHNCQIVRERHRQLVHRRPLLPIRRDLREVSTHRCRAIEHSRRIGDAFLELNSRGRQPFPVRRDARAETASLRKRRRGRAGCREAPRLVNAPQFFRVTLRPTARHRRVVVDEDIRAVIHCGAIEDRLNQNKGLAILITRRVGQFVVGSRELPVEEPEEGAPAGFFVRGKTRWEQRRDCGWIGPVLDRDAIAGIMPRRQGRQRGFSAGGERN